MNEFLGAKFWTGAFFASFAIAVADDSPAVKEHIEKAKKIAGQEWAQQEVFFCENPHGNRPDDPVIEPTKIFDNVWAVGSVSVTIYAIETSEGWVLIDAGYPGQADTVLLPQLKKAGIDESKVKYIFIGHGHPDHDGAAKYFQDKYRTRIVLSTADWDLLDPPIWMALRRPDYAPRRDITVNDGQTIKIGDFAMTAILLPGHTPGSLGYIFPVKEGNKTYTAGLFGGTVLVPRIAWDLDMYLKTLKKWQNVAKKYNIEVQLQNHPHMLNLQEKLDKIKSRKPGEPNPFYVPTPDYTRYFGMIAECTLAQKQRSIENPNTQREGDR